MKLIGVLYGMSDYTANYYAEQIKRRLLQETGQQVEIMSCPQVWQIEKLVRERKWEEVVQIMVRGAQTLWRGREKVEFVVIPSFTLHMAADAIEASGIPIVRMDDCIIEAVTQMEARRVAVLNAEVAKEEYLLRFYERLDEIEGCKLIRRTLSTLSSMVEFDHLTLGNQPRTRETLREYCWWYTEAAQKMAERAEVILNASVEMTRVLGLKNAGVPASGESGPVPIVNVVDLHMNKIIQACST